LFKQSNGEIMKTVRTNLDLLLLFDITFQRKPTVIYVHTSYLKEAKL